MPPVSLVTPDVALLDAATGDPATLADALRCTVVDGWVIYRGALERARATVAADPASARWGPRFFVLDEPRTLVGWGGFKGPPQEGIVEIGYEIAAAFRGRGLATAATEALVREAWAAPEVDAVIAHTLAEPGPSPRVLEKCAFARDGESLDGDVGAVWRFRLARPVLPATDGVVATRGATIDP